MFDGQTQIFFQKGTWEASLFINKNILYDLNQIYTNLFSKCAKTYLALDTNIYYVYLSL
jgi:hypothetical protein